MSTGWIIIAFIGATALFLIMLYNRLVALKNNRVNAFADIDVQLKLRYDLIPNLVNTVKGYAAHEKGVFEKVTEMRAKAMNTGNVSIGEKIGAEQALSGALMNLMAVAENYPQLKADQNFLSLQQELSDIENKIAAARRFFNNATNELNTSVKQFPAVLFAGMFGFKEEAFFYLGAEREQVSKTPTVNFS
jgi:LemA protein